MSDGYIILKGRKYLIEIEMIDDIPSRDFVVTDSIYCSDFEKRVIGGQFVVNRMLVTPPEEIKQNILSDINKLVESRLTELLG